MNDPLTRLQRWYAGRCDGDWEHQHGVTIGTLDNPGWTLSVDLVDTEWEGLQMPPFSEGDSAEDASWLACGVENQRFHGACSPERLHELVERFLRIVEQPPP